MRFRVKKILLENSGLPDTGKALDFLFCSAGVIPVKSNDRIPGFRLRRQLFLYLTADLIEGKRTVEGNDDIEDQIGMGRAADNTEVMKRQRRIDLYRRSGYP